MGSLLQSASRKSGAQAIGRQAKEENEKGEVMAVYRPKYKDPKTGQLKEQTVWWCEFQFAGKRYRESTKTTRKTLAAQYEQRRHLELERHHATGKRSENTARMLRAV